MNRFHKMNRFFKSCLLASAGLVVLAVTLSLTAPGRAFAQRVGQDCVRICDTASNPLHVIVRGVTHVTGDVRISNEDAIATTVSGPVQVTTSPREPLYVIPRLKVENIFQEQVSLTLQPGEMLAKKNFVVPAAKFLEIKYASGTATVKTPEPAFAFTDFTVSISVIQPNNSTYNFPLTKNVQGVSYANNEAFGSYQVGGTQVGIFGDSGGTIQVVLKRASNWGSGYAEINLELAISGEYQDTQ
ncbi:MAG: hypothetical protein LC785_04575 [Acidobacteria bacterium]|nr:hypothetical protein [Acidobacteriota bacterium]MCA1641258.1 hypothetical protein [Acidobacteriota bacterium]